MDLIIKSKYNDKSGQWLLNMTGEIDIASSKELKEIMTNNFEEKAENVVLDFTNLDYIDSTGLGIIIGAYGRMKDHGKEITIINPKDNVKKLLSITQLDKIFMK